MTASIFLSAAHKSSGKTTVAIGLCAAFAQRGVRVQPFKKGPDYIDPMWLGQAAGRACYNLDFYTMQRDEIAQLFARHAGDAELALIEGNKGLYDGLDLDGSNSNAALAKLLGVPVVLVLDAQGMTRGIAPLILGYQAFDPQVKIAGVILNQLGGRRHESKLRAVIEHYTDVKVLGAILRDPQLEIVERHLGLMPNNEAPQAGLRISAIAERVAEQVDLDALSAIAHSGSTTLVLRVPQIGSTDSSSATRPKVRVGIARDAAFGFYYPDDLDALQQAGAQLVPINTLRDSRLPEIDALFIGGGFPETHMQALEENAAIRADIRASIETGLPTYAECGGLMYLARSIQWGDRRNEMVGVLPGDIVMHAQPQGRGYVRLEETSDHPWPGGVSGEIPAHEFHYSSIINLEPGLRTAYRVRRGTGVDGIHDGLVYKNLLASYTHLRDVGANRWAERFLAFARTKLSLVRE